MKRAYDTRLAAAADALSAAACLGSVFAALLSFYFANTPLRIAAVALGLAVFGAMALRSRNQTLLVLSLVLVASSLPIALMNAVTTEFKSLFVPLCFLASVGYAWFALERRRTVLLYEFPFFAYLALTVQLILMRGYGPVEFDAFFAGIGRNGYSAILVAMTCGYILSRQACGRVPSPLWVIVALACSFPLYGRSSISALALLAFSTSAYRFPKATFIATSLAGFFLFAGDLDLSLISSATNFKVGVDSLRWLFIDQYVDALDPATALVGVDFANLPAVKANDGSPDLAFLRLHSYLGISALGYLACFLVSGLGLFVRGQMLLLAVFAAILVRSFTDIILLFGTVDQFFIPVLFFPCFELYFPKLRAPRGLNPASGSQMLPQIVSPSGAV